MKVSQSTINEIQKLGMKGSLEKWRSGQGSPEFNEAVKRYYGAGHRTNVSGGGSAAESGPAPKMTQDSGASSSPPVGSSSGGTQSRLVDTPAKRAAAARRVAPGRKVSEMSLEERVESGRKALDARPGMTKGKSLIGNPANSAVNAIGNLITGTVRRTSERGREAARKQNTGKHNMPETGRESSLSGKQKAALKRLR